MTVEAVGEPRVSTSELARLLRSFEHSMSAEPPSRVVLADDSDAALAAALVASKLLIPLSVRSATPAASRNAAVIAQLASA
jgi:hypothetical protein